MRGYDCIKKFLQEPEGVEISYRFSGNLDFPSIAFCPHEQNNGNSSLLPQPLNISILESCDLTIWDYLLLNGPGLCSLYKKE